MKYTAKYTGFLPYFYVYENSVVVVEVSSTYAADFKRAAYI